nr:unnamed protein product [Callosobruchus chinensis]
MLSFRPLRNMLRCLLQKKNGSNEQKSNFPDYLGAIDGKHCIIQAPIHSGSDYFNYKQNFSIVLLGIADSDYCFCLRISDAKVGFLMAV